ncbi:multiprotein bridging factor aMBF1 [Archaeoglobus sp.]|uniref:multiprotein bridging factor aMBF1 n=1 Tax=Archaeoglobus sp. TaxID=1872626 RepID=UPI0025B8BC71|nr:multiprotein bridging factor aMBF1 [Archaeoglobus sp.]
MSEMNCEICGREIKGKGFKIVVEGSEVTVCSSCRQYGTEKKPSVASQPGARRVVLKKKRASTKIEFTEELVENFHLIIKREREKRGWSQEQLAKKIQEKESLIKKIENAEITPEPEVVEKLEKLFNIKLREQVPEIKIEKGKSLVPTLGDIVVVKRKKK